MQHDIHLDLREAVILVVDDSRLGNEMLSRSLEQHNCHVIAERDPEVAFLRAVEATPDLILMDFETSVSRGIAFCEKLTESPVTKDVPVIFISGTATRDEWLQGLDGGAVDIISKPFDLIELGFRIRNHIELRRARETVRKANAQLEALNKRKDEFLGIAAHDLRNPLGGINGFAELMLMNSALDDEKRKKYLSYILETSQYMTTLLNNFLDISKIEQEAFDIKIKPLSVGEIAESVIRLNETHAVKKDQTLHVEIDAEIPEISSDGNILTQIFANFISNAVKYSPLGGDIRIVLRVDGEHLHFSVKDSGPGIPKEGQEKLFKDYARLDTEPTAGEKANGLGLAIVGKLAKKIHVAVGCESELGAGALFWARLPMEHRIQGSHSRPPINS